MRIVFMGTPRAALPSLEKLVEKGYEIVAVYTQPDKPAGRGQRLAASPVKEFALSNGLEVFQPHKIKTAEQIERFRSHKADVVVVVAYGKILPKEFLEAYPLGAVNVHFSLLPKYRGAAPVNWAIANGEKITGVTTMKMNEGLDTGDILLQRTVEIGEDETSSELMERLSLLGSELLLETLENLDKIKPQKQDESLASYAPMLKKEDGLINWQMTATEIRNRIRGFQPFPTCYTFFRGKKVTIWKAYEVPERGEGEGMIAFADKQLLVSCGSGTMLKIEELQPEGKRRMTASDFLNGWRPKTGEKFTNSP
ncbi:MAG: methionyl-tRNA formyltransferase [Pyrinomonadaceae bacterium]|nr:methionyl-tRNA formyltransferase [Pyrinomonadaceae bacterium]MCX7640616.1 methionyl-tRNA formyltransferase [Pyrinomonadaceae bacterium]MDW8305156.1 methionyl-tRNA formyltransferase [Acidobacteriota bacterium]